MTIQVTKSVPRFLQYMYLHSKDCFNMLKGINDVFREIQPFQRCFLFGQMDDLTQREDKWIAGLILHICMCVRSSFIIKNTMFKNRSSNIDLYLLPYHDHLLRLYLTRKQRNNAFLSKLDILST